MEALATVLGSTREGSPLSRRLSSMGMAVPVGHSTTTIQLMEPMLTYQWNNQSIKTVSLFIEKRNINGLITSILCIDIDSRNH